MQRLVAFAALNRAAPSRGYVAGTLWPDGADTLAQNSLRGLLCRIRRRPDLDGLLSISETTLALGHDVRVDVHDLHQALSSTDPPSQDALDLLTSGELLPGWYDDWLTPERERLHQPGCTPWSGWQSSTAGRDDTVKRSTRLLRPSASNRCGRARTGWSSGSTCRRATLLRR